MKKRTSDKGFGVKSISWKNENQKKVIECDKNMVLSGSAGTGKSFLALHKGLKEVFKGEKSRVVVVRSATPVKDLGHLPGSLEEKEAAYSLPYQAIVKELFERDDAWEVLKTKKQISFMTTSFIRGLTLKDTFVIVDEIQNSTFQELDSIITRIGENCKIFFCGDFKQTDLKCASGMKDFLKILKELEEFEEVEFTTDDIVRSGLVKAYLQKKEALQKV